MAPEALAPAVERAIRSLEPGLPLYDVQSMSKSLNSGLGFFPVRVAAAAAATLGLMAFALAIVGLYGVISYLAGQRRHEIGVRMAVGATEGDIVRLVLSDGVALVVGGLTSGLVVALLVSRVMGRFLFGISACDPLTFLSVAPMLGAVALVACAVPAWRAARVDPGITLRMRSQPGFSEHDGYSSDRRPRASPRLIAR
jgi:ABC-type antimicrobial peptide transport system permease subunit